MWSGGLNKWSGWQRQRMRERRARERERERGERKMQREYELKESVQSKHLHDDVYSDSGVDGDE